MNEIKLSVKELVELLYGGGDLTSDRSLLLRAEEGTKAHQYLQAKYKEQDQKEVVVNYEGTIDEIHFVLSGRIDGLLSRSKKTIIEEIKSTTQNLEDLTEDSIPAHIAQAKMYAYMYCLEQHKKRIYIRLTYIEIDRYKTSTFENKFTFEELEIFFINTLKEYAKFARIIEEHEEKRNKSIEGLHFPFADYRPGQREFMKECYLSILNKSILYAIAPTGIGKTIATLFSALKALNDRRQKVFYLTAKNAQKKVVMETAQLLMDKGLNAKTCEITAKDQMCFMKTKDCDKENCIFAKGYYHRLYPAIKDLYQNETIFSKEIIKEYAQKHQLCPFEFSLDISNYADIILCDYNYAFDPRVHLIRYFDDDAYRPILLVDEAHNLITRSREMYSASLSRNMLASLLGKVKDVVPTPYGEINAVLNQFKLYEKELQDVTYTCQANEDVDMVYFARRLLQKIDKILLNKEPFVYRLELLNVSFELAKFVAISEYYRPSNFVYSLERSYNDIICSIKCLDASDFLLEVMQKKSDGNLLFSATLFPLPYYQKLLSKEVGHSVIIPPPFPQENLKLIMMDHTSTRYNDRQNSVEQIIEIIHTMVKNKQGNYIVFFPSYAYMDLVKEKLQAQYPEYDYIIQKKDLSMAEREEVILLFQKDITSTQIGLFVMGGMFAEGIDYIGDMLSGVVVVGCGLPMVGGYNNMLKSYFDEKLGSGFDYAYTYPGFAKVVQAVGRVIRSETDRGVAILIDDRFTNNRYKRLYPKQWSHFEIINGIIALDVTLKNFWKQEE